MSSCFMARKSEVFDLATITDGKFILVRMRNVGKFYLTYEFNIHAGHQLINFIASEIRKVYWLAQQVLQNYFAWVRRRSTKF